MSYLKDLIIYLIPGMMLNLSIVAILFDKDAILVVKYLEVVKSEAFIAAFIIFSILLGFIQSQFQIQLLNVVLHRLSDPRKVKNQKLNPRLEKNLIHRMRKEFRCWDLPDEEIAVNSSFFYQCLSTVHLQENRPIHGVIDRSISISLFSCVITIPLIVTLYYVFTKIALACPIKWTLYSISAGVSTFVCIRTSIEFRKIWIATIYRAFLLR